MATRDPHLRHRFLHRHGVGLLKLLGVAYRPELADLPDQKLWRIDPPRVRGSSTRRLGSVLPWGDRERLRDVGAIWCMVMRLAVLWDIDHTLIETRGVGRELYQEAFEQVTGVSFQRSASVSGSTEFRIFSETLALHDLPATGELAPAYARALAALHIHRYAELQERGRALPGARDALVALDSRGYVQTVVTGNLRAVAVTKLQAFGLADLLNLEVGAFAENGEDREDLVRVAMTRAAADRAVLIGDTPSDITAARANSVPVIGVANGRSGVEELRAAGADVTLADLTNVDEVVAAVVRLTTA